MKPTRKNVVAVIFMSLLLLTACDKKKEKEKEPEPTANPEEQSATVEAVPAPVSMLGLIPDDTVIFSGSLEPFPLKEVMKWSADRFKMPKEIATQEMLHTKEGKAPDGQRMAVQLWADYYATAVSPETRLERWGIAEKPLLASYTVGLAPVLLRISLKDVQQFNRKIDEIEAKAKVAAKPETLGKATYRRYMLNEKDPQIHLIIGVDSNDAVVMLDIGVDSQETLAVALGQKKPEKSLEESGRLDSLQKEYKMYPAFFAGYIDHQQIITGLTTKNGNSMAKMLQGFIPQLKDAANTLTELQTEGCRNDLQAIGENWPRTVFGYTALDLTSKPSRIDSIIVVESKDKPLLEGLKSLRGFIPDYVRNPAEPAVFSLGIGLNVQNMAPFLMQQWTKATQKEYKCSLLKEMQQSSKGQNPAMMSMASAMAGSVRGIAFSLLSLTPDASAKAGGLSVPKDIDAIVSLSAKDPAFLLQTVSGMVPPLAALQIPTDGTPVELPVLPISLPFTLMGAINGSHMTVYAGQKAGGLAKELREVSLEASQGVMAMDIDYGKYYGLLGKTVSDMGAMDAQNAEIFAAMKDSRMRLQTEMDFTDRGIEIKADLIATE